MLGRDPAREPLSELELVLFERATLEHVEAEFRPREDLAAMTGMHAPSND